MSKIKTLKYLPKLSTAILFLVLLILMFLLFSGRKSETLKANWILNYLPDFYQHVSNFCISYILYAGIGYIWVLLDVSYRYIIGMGILFLMANFIYELWIPIINTRDIVDAYYGVAGTFIGFIFLFLTKEFGIKLNNANYVSFTAVRTRLMNKTRIFIFSLFTKDIQMLFHLLKRPHATHEAVFNLNYTT